MQRISQAFLLLYQLLYQNYILKALKSTIFVLKLVKL